MAELITDYEFTQVGVVLEPFTVKCDGEGHVETVIGGVYTPAAMLDKATDLSTLRRVCVRNGGCPSDCPISQLIGELRNIGNYARNH